MTDCFQKSTWDRVPKKRSLEDAFNPEPDHGYDSGGIAERASDTARAACEAVGKLTALLIEKKVITIKEAGDALGVYPRPYFEGEEQDDDAD